MSLHKANIAARSNEHQKNDAAAQSLCLKLRPKEHEQKLESQSNFDIKSAQTSKTPKLQNTTSHLIRQVISLLMSFCPLLGHPSPLQALLRLLMFPLLQLPHQPMQAQTLPPSLWKPSHVSQLLTKIEQADRLSKSVHGTATVAP
mmetsp:Transcript_91696/g.159047  ORF Transcript_91696/g.159047 Transcript_91696/m.159047 type:complete len:145 (-) Transcript_91696:1140-1574(-)